MIRVLILQTNSTGINIRKTSGYIQSALVVKLRGSHVEPYCSIQIWYLAISLGETLFRQRLNASVKSFSVTGRSTSSFFIRFISAGLLPDIFLRMAIIAASRQTLLISAAVYPSSLSAIMFVSRFGSIVIPWRHRSKSFDRVSSTRIKMIIGNCLWDFFTYRWVFRCRFVFQIDVWKHHRCPKGGSSLLVPLLFYCQHWKGKISSRLVKNFWKLLVRWWVKFSISFFNFVFGIFCSKFL